MTPATVQLGLLKTAAFTATVASSVDTLVIWSVPEAGGGSVDATGHYTAPAVPGAYHVVATSTAAPSVSGAATVSVGGLPSLQVQAGALLDEKGHRVILRGVNAEGVANIIVNRATQGGIGPYLDKVIGADATGRQWPTRAIRLPFERYPCADRTRLYQFGDARIPWSVPDIHVPAVPDWAPSAPYAANMIVKSGAVQYIATKRTWHADKGQAWNVGQYAPGDLVVGIYNTTDANASENRVYRCTGAQTSVPASPAWDHGPNGTGTSTDAVGATWQYLGDWGTSGASAPFGGAEVFDGSADHSTLSFGGYWDNLVSWQGAGPYQDITPAQGLANFQHWMSTVLDPTLQACVARQLYCIVTDFDFGPANHPLRAQRLLDFWGQLSTSKWANHPQVLFDLWNESEDIDDYAGFAPTSWATQKSSIQAAVDLIRSNRANNVIITPTPGFNAYTDAATASPLSGASIVYSAHHYSPYYFNNNDAHLAAALASGQAVLLEEWGPGDDASTTDAANFAAALKLLIEPSSNAAHPAVGNLAWAFTDSWFPNMFSDSALTQPTQFGLVTRSWLNDLQADSQPSP